MRFTRLLVFLLSVPLLAWGGAAIAAPVMPMELHISHSIILNQSSNDGPALWTSGDAAFTPQDNTASAILAWTGTNSQHFINLMTSRDGLDYGNKLTLDVSALARPAITIVREGGFDKTVVAFTASDRHLTVIYNVYGHRQVLRLDELSNTAPALAQAADGKLWLAWTGTDTHRTLNVEALAIKNSQLEFVSKKILAGYYSQAAPNLAYDHTHKNLLLSWSDTGASGYLPVKDHFINALWSANGSEWARVQSQPQPRFSKAAPALFNEGPPLNNTNYILAWAGVDTAHKLNLATTTNVFNWSVPTIVLNQAAFGGPAVGYLNGSLHIALAWTGTDRNHTINVAWLRV